MFHYAVNSDWLVRSPCRNINLPSEAIAQRIEVTPDQVGQIVAAIDAEYQPMIWLGAVLGLRWGEVAGLTVGSLDLLRGTLSVTSQLDRTGKLSPPKSQAGRRHLTMPSPLVGLLADHLAVRGMTGAHSEALVFTTSGGPLDYTNWRRRVWLPAVKGAGVPRASFHDLRRTSASQMVANGVDVKVAQPRLGHSSVRLTLDVYAKAETEADRKAADRMGETFFGSRTQRARWLSQPRRRFGALGA